MLAVGHGIAVLRLAAVLDGGVDLRHGYVADVEVAGLELFPSGLDVLLNGKVNAVYLGLVLAIVVVELLEVDLLTILPLAVHLERAVADGSQVEALGVILGSSRHGSQCRVRGNIGEVGVRGRQLDHKRKVVRAGKTGKLVGIASGEFVIALDERKVIGNLRRAVLHRNRALGIHDTSPCALEGLGIHGVAVVELSPLAQMEGELGSVVAGIPGLGGKTDDLVLVVVKVSQRIEQLEGNLRALVLLDVIGIDADGIIDVVVDGGTRGCAGSGASGAGAALLAAGSQECERARSEGAAHESATTHNGLMEFEISHAILLKCRTWTMHCARAAYIAFELHARWLCGRIHDWMYFTLFWKSAVCCF